MKKYKAKFRLYEVTENAFQNVALGENFMEGVVINKTMRRVMWRDDTQMMFLDTGPERFLFTVAFPAEIEDGEEEEAEDSQGPDSLQNIQSH